MLVTFFRDVFGVGFKSFDSYFIDWVWYCGFGEFFFIFDFIGGRDDGLEGQVR